MVYAISGFCAALGGLLFSLYMLSGYSLHAVGHGARRDRGGRHRRHAAHRRTRPVVGSLLGVLVLGTIQTFVSFDGTLSSWWTKIIIGVLLLVFVVVQRFITRRQT